MKNWIRKQFRKKARVYILPTKMGGYLNGLIFLMFLLAIGYANNLLLIFTTFLLAFNLLWLIQTHFHLYRLKLDQIAVYAGHAESPIKVQLFWKTTPKEPWSWEIILESDKGEFGYISHLNGKSRSEGEIIAPHRGAYQWKYARVKTNRPFGLYQVWVYFPLNAVTLVYPALLTSAEITLSGKDFEGELLQDKKGADDFRGLASYANDEARKISWKHYARTGELLIKEGEEKLSPLLELELKVPHNSEQKEKYLSYVATQIVECHRKDIPFSMRVNGQSSSQLLDCLQVLAKC